MLERSSIRLRKQEFNGHFNHNHPPLIADHITEIEEFARVCRLVLILRFGSDVKIQSLHSEVLDPLHILLAIALELPEDYFTSRHQYEVKSEVSAYSILSCYLFYQVTK